MVERNVVLAAKLLVIITLTVLSSIVGLPCGALKAQEVDERIVYYYRDPGFSKLISVLDSIAKEQQIPTDTKKRAALVHFFAAAFRGNVDDLAELDALVQKYPGESASFIKDIIDLTYNYAAVRLKSPEDLGLLWAEYWATGNKDIIPKLLSAATGEVQLQGKDSREALQWFLIRTAPHHWELYQAINDAANDAATANKRELIKGVAEAVKISAFDPASNCVHRSGNHHEHKEYDKAMEEVRKSLSYFPDYYISHAFMGNIYAAQKNMPEAIKAVRKSLSIFPENASALANLALYYRILNKDNDDEAIALYRKALEIEPDKINVIYGLAGCYSRKYDTENAVKYYKRYLDLAPNGQHAVFAKQYLRWAGRLTEEDSSDIAVLLQSRKYEELDKALGKILAERKKDKEGQTLLHQAYEKLCNVQKPERSFENKISQARAWLAKIPSSHFANACLGTIYFHYAWEARGSGYASTIVEEGRRLFKERLHSAREYLETAYSLDVSDQAVASTLIWTGIGLGSPREEIEKQFRRATSADPTDPEAYFSKLVYLAPKWHGSKEEMFSFAREVSKKPPRNSKICVVLAVAHWEMYLYLDEDPSYFRNPAVWKEVKDSYEGALKVFPQANHIRNWLIRSAYLAGDYATARREFAVLGDDWYARTWGSKKNFEEVRSKMMAK